MRSKIVKMSRLCKILLAFSLVFAGNLSAREMTWQDIVNDAKTINPTIRKAGESLKKAELNYKISRANFLPQVSATAGASRSGSDSISSADSYTCGVSGNLSLFSGFSDINGLKIKDLDIKIEKEKYRRTISDLLYDLKTSYINLLWSQVMVDLSKEIYDRRVKNYELIHQRYVAGREDKGSLLRVEADMVQAEYDHIQSKRSLEEVSLQLSLEIGENGSELINAKGDFHVSYSSADPSFDILLNKIPDYTVSALNIERSKFDIKVAKSNFYPDITLSGNALKSGNDYPPDYGSWSTAINMSFPVFSGGKNIYNLNISQTNMNLTEKTHLETVIKYKTTLKTAWNSLLKAIESVRVKDKFMAASEEQSMITTKKYLNGLATYFDWYNVENDFINSKRALLNAKRDALLAEARWENILGGE